MYAWQPWSGHYTVAPTVWASAHTTQFVERGWTMPFGAAGNLPAGGSFVGFVSPAGDDFSLVFETATGAGCHHCKYAPSTAATVPQHVTVSVAQLKRAVAAVAVWRSNETHQFVRLADAPVDAAGRVALTIAPGAIYSVSSTSGQRKGAATPPAASARFPATWHDDFDGGRTEGLGRFWADQCGSFQLLPAEGGRGLAMTQRVTTRPGVNRWANNLEWPLTVLGDATDAAPDRVVSASVLPLPADAGVDAATGAGGPAASLEHSFSSTFRHLRTRPDPRWWRRSDGRWCSGSPSFRPPWPALECRVLPSSRARRDAHCRQQRVPLRYRLRRGGLRKRLQLHAARSGDGRLRVAAPYPVLV